MEYPVYAIEYKGKPNDETRKIADCENQIKTLSEVALFELAVVGGGVGLCGPGLNPPCQFTPLVTQSFGALGPESANKVPTA